MPNTNTSWIWGIGTTVVNGGVLVFASSHDVGLGKNPAGSSPAGLFDIALTCTKKS